MQNQTITIPHVKLEMTNMPFNELLFPETMWIPVPTLSLVSCAAMDKSFDILRPKNENKIIFKFNEIISWLTGINREDNDP